MTNYNGEEINTSGQVIDKVGNAIPSGQLQPSNPIQIPTQKYDSTSADALASGVQSGTDQFQADQDRYMKAAENTAGDSNLQSLLTDYLNTSNQNTGYGAAQLQKEQDLGIPDLQRQRATSQGLIKTGLAEYNAMKTQYEKSIADAEIVAGKTGQTWNMFLGTQGAIDRQKLAGLNNKAADIGILQAQDLALSGNIEAAQKIADRAIDLQYKDRQSLLDAKKTAYELNRDILEKTDAKRAKALEYALKKEETALKEEADEKKAKEKMIIEAAPFAPSDILTKAREAKTSLEAAQILGKYGGDYMQAELLKEQIKTEKAQQSNYFANAAKTRAETGLLGTTGGGKPATQAQFTAAGFASRVNQSKDIIDQNANELNKLNTVQFAAQRALPNALQKPLIQKQLQAERNFINAVLRRESGAAISPTEFDSASQQYFPRPGDSDAVLLQKKANRDLTSQNLINESGSAFQPSIEIDYVENIALPSISNVQNQQTSSSGYANRLLGLTKPK